MSTIAGATSDHSSNIQISKDNGITVVENESNIVIYSGTDDVDAIEKTLNEIDTGTIFFKKGTYNIDRTVFLKPNVAFVGDEGVIFNCCFNGIAFNTEDVGYSSSTIILSNNAYSGDSQIKLSSVSELNVGDYLKISDDFGIFNEERNFQYGQIATNGKTYFRNGEIVKINRIEGNKITIDKPLYDDYSTVKNAKIKKISMLKNITFENIDFIGYGMGTSSAAIYLYGTQNCKISNCKFADFGRATNLIDCLDCVIEKNIFRRIYLDGTGYSIALGNACDNIIIKNNSFLEKGRHYISVGGATGNKISDGLCRTIYVTNNVFEGSTDEAVNTHPSTRSTFSITNNKFTNCVKGVEFSNTNSTIKGNTFVNCINSIELYGTGNHLIKENLFSGEKSSIGIYVCNSNGGAYNIISNTISVKNYGILLENTGSSTIQDKIIIQNNNIYASTEISANGYSNVIVNKSVTDAIPIAAFSITPTSGNAPLKVIFTDNSTGLPTEWNWNFGDGTYSEEQNPIHTYTKAGNYTVIFTASNSVGSNEVKESNCITVTEAIREAEQKPVVSFWGSKTSGDTPLTLGFTDASTGSPTSWKWSFGDGTYSTEQKPKHTYSKAGTYTVTLTASNAAGSGTLTRANYITSTGTTVSKPVASFWGSRTSGTIPLTITFTDASTNTPTSWNWSFGDGTYSTLQNPKHTYSKAGTYTVTLTASNAAGSEMKTRVNYITLTGTTVSKPVVSFWGSKTSGTAPLTITFTDASTNTPTSWNWSFGDGTYSTLQNPKHTYSKAGTYTVTLTASNATGSEMKTRTNYIKIT